MVVIVGRTAAELERGYRVLALVYGVAFILERETGSVGGYTAAGNRLTGELDLMAKDIVALLEMRPNA